MEPSVHELLYIGMSMMVGCVAVACFTILGATAKLTEALGEMKIEIANRPLAPPQFSGPAPYRVSWDYPARNYVIDLTGADYG